MYNSLDSWFKVNVRFKEIQTNDSLITKSIGMVADFEAMPAVQRTPLIA